MFTVDVKQQYNNNKVQRILMGIKIGNVHKFWDIYELFSTEAPRKNDGNFVLQCLVSKGLSKEESVYIIFL